MLQRYGHKMVLETGRRNRKSPTPSLLNHRTLPSTRLSSGTKHAACKDPISVRSRKETRQCYLYMHSSINLRLLDARGSNRLDQQRSAATGNTNALMCAMLDFFVHHSIPHISCKLLCGFFESGLKCPFSQHSSRLLSPKKGASCNRSSLEGTATLAKMAHAKLAGSREPAAGVTTYEICQAWPFELWF